MAFFTDFKHEGRFVNVEISEDKGKGTSRNKRRRDGGGSKRRSEDKPRGDRRSGSRGEGNRSDRRSSVSNESRPRRSKSEAGLSRPRRSRR